MPEAIGIFRFLNEELRECGLPMALCDRHRRLLIIPINCKLERIGDAHKECDDCIQGKGYEGEMTLADILAEARKIWPERMSLTDIAVCLTVVTGDVARCARGAKKDFDEDIAKELGNLIASAVRWCDDLRRDPEDCVELALEAQREYRKREG
jgi:hypothetical protein